MIRRKVRVSVISITNMEGSGNGGHQSYSEQGGSIWSNKIRRGEEKSDKYIRGHSLCGYMYA